MANTYTLISSNTLSGSAASVTFSSIPATYTDLVVRASIRTDYTAILTGTLVVQVNGSDVGSYTYLKGDGSAATSGRSTTSLGVYQSTNGGNTTANTFSSLELYLPNYANTSVAKSFSAYQAAETNAAAVNMSANALLFNSTNAITSLGFTSAGSANLLAGSSFYLYGIKNS